MNPWIPRMRAAATIPSAPYMTYKVTLVSDSATRLSIDSCERISVDDQWSRSP
jgi:hypothetical protein